MPLLRIDFYVKPYFLIFCLITDHMVMKRTLPDPAARTITMDFPGHAGFILRNDLPAIRILFIAQYQNHMDMVRHDHIFVHPDTIIMLRYPQNVVSRNRPSVVQCIRLPEDAPAIMSTDRDIVIITGGIIKIGNSR